MFANDSDFFICEGLENVNSYLPYPNKPAVLMNYVNTQVGSHIFNLYFPNKNVINGGTPI